MNQLLEGDLQEMMGDDGGGDSVDDTLPSEGGRGACVATASILLDEI